MGGLQGFSGPSGPAGLYIHSNGTRGDVSAVPGAGGNWACALNWRCIGAWRTTDAAVTCGSGVTFAVLKNLFRGLSSLSVLGCTAVLWACVWTCAPHAVVRHALSSAAAACRKPRPRRSACMLASLSERDEIDGACVANALCETQPDGVAWKLWKLVVAGRQRHAGCMES